MPMVQGGFMADSRWDFAASNSSADTMEELLLVVSCEREGPREGDVQGERGAQVARQEGG